MQKTKLFLLSFLAAISFFLGINLLYSNIEDFLFAIEMENNPPVLANIAQTANKQEQEGIQIDSSFVVGECLLNEIKAKSFISVLIKGDGVGDSENEKILFEKNSQEKLAIASLTKLLSALVAKQFLPENEKITITGEAVSQTDQAGFLREGERLTLDELLKIMLIESSNDAAFALAEEMGEGFVFLINKKAQEIGMANSLFLNPMGLDPDDLNLPASEINLSTAQDMFILGKHLLFKAKEIIDITKEKELTLFLENGSFHHIVQNTNELLGKNPYIIGGKTGLTEKAEGCLILFLSTDEPNEYIINIVLGSPDRFNDMEILNNCSLSSLTSNDF